jgi:hypothetical protein
MKYCPQKTCRRGAIIVYAALCMTVLVGLAALTIDIGFKHDRLRHLQGAADASAMSGAGDMYRHWLSNFGADPSNTARDAATAIATANGYTSGANGATVTIHIPPTSSAHFNGLSGYVEAIITHQQSRFFSRMFGSGTLQTQARAVARANYSVIGEGVIVLDRYTSGALNAHGGGIMTLIGSSGMIVDSNSATAGITNGSVGSQLRAPLFTITGNYNETGSSTFAQSDGSTPANFVLGAPPTPDPLAYLPPPPIPGVAPKPTVVNLGGGIKQYTYSPGLYTSNGNGAALSNSGQDVVILLPGIYYLQGGFSYNASGGLTAAGVMLYNDPTSSQSQGISITGQGVVNMSPYVGSEYPYYDGILLYQNRTADVTVQITGNGNYTVTGTVYAASALVKIAGNGDASIGSQYISRTLDIGGNGNLTIDYSAAPHPHKRVLQLVE